jgi:hypothetical protein
MPDLIGLANEEAKAGLTLREAIDMYREQVEEEEFEECDFCASLRSRSVFISLVSSSIRLPHFCSQLRRWQHLP